MTTARDIVLLALKNSGAWGVGQTPLAEDTNDAFTMLNQMIAQWSRKRWMIWSLVTGNVTATGAVTYSIGATGDIVAASGRPAQIEAAFFRQVVTSQPNQVDYPIEILHSREDYNRITLKQLATFPMYLWYDPTLPNGTLYPWPVPTATIYSLFVTYMAPLTQFANLATDVGTMPDEYQAALYYNLALRLRGPYGIEPPMGDNIPALAKNALQTIKAANMQIPRLEIPSNLIRPGVYNPYADTYR